MAHRSPADLLTIWQSRRMSDSAQSKGTTLDVSRLQHAYLTAELGVNGGGRGVDRAAAKQLADLWHWWARNVRGRIWEPPLPGLFDQVEPPRRPATIPDVPTAGDWVDAVQQHGWWDAARRDGGGHPARKQTALWARVRDAAAPTATAELHAALGLVDVHEQPFLNPQSAPMPARIGKW